MTGQTLHGGLELTLEQCYNDGLVQQLVFAPGQLCCHLIVQMVVFLLFVALPVVRLTPEKEKQERMSHPPTNATSLYQTM